MPEKQSIEVRNAKARIDKPLRLWGSDMKTIERVDVRHWRRPLCDIRGSTCCLLSE